MLASEGARLNAENAEEDLPEVPEMPGNVQRWLDYLSNEFPHLFGAPEEVDASDDSSDDDDEQDEQIGQQIDADMSQIQDFSQLHNDIDNAIDNANRSHASQSQHDDLSGPPLIAQTPGKSSLSFPLVALLSRYKINEFIWWNILTKSRSNN